MYHVREDIDHFPQTIGIGQGGVLLKNFVCGCACWTSKFWYSQCSNWGHFMATYSFKINPNKIYVNWAPSFEMKNLLIADQNSWKSVPKGRHIIIYTYTKSMWEPDLGEGGRGGLLALKFGFDREVSSQNLRVDHTYRADQFSRKMADYVYQ